MKKIPLHSLVILVGPASGGKSTIAGKYFESYEILGAEAVRHALVGDQQRMDINDQVFREIHRRTIIKLDLGERVVVDATNLRKKDRMSLTEIGIRIGVPVYYLVCNRSLDDKLAESGKSWRLSAHGVIMKHDHVFRSNERDILRGDGYANVIDARVDNFQVTKKLAGDDLMGSIKEKGYRGIMAIGDVHGMLEPLKNATEWASSRGLFCVFLGDIVDYGPNSLECVEHVYETVTRGRGVSVIGNHERKIERWLNQIGHDAKVRLSEGNRVTTRAIDSLGADARRRFETRYRALLGFARHHWIVGNTLFTHGAAEPEMFDINSARLTNKFETMALFGEVDNNAPQRADGYPTRIYEWVNRVPRGKQVMVGHDIRSTVKPLHVEGKAGGDVYFMDTGSGKGGRLTSADVIFQDDQLVVKAFKYH